MQENNLNTLKETSRFAPASACNAWNKLVGIEPMPIKITLEKLRINISDVKIIVPNKVVEVTFADGTKEKAVCDKTDKFSLEMAISICISKKIMGGTNAYNKAVRQGLKVYNKKIEERNEEKKKQEIIERKRKKKRIQKERRLARKAAIEKEKQIEIQKEAYIRAMEYLEEKKNQNQ